MNKGNFLSSGVYGCVYNPAYTCDGKRTQEKQYVTKLVKRDFTTKIEVIAGKALANTDGFLTVVKKCDITQKELKESTMVKHCRLFEKDQQIKKEYELLYLKYIKSKELSDYLNKKKSKNAIVKSYMVMCKRIAVMIEKGIIHHDLHFGNILYDGSNLYVIDFGLSLIKKYFFIDNKINKPYLKKAIFDYSPTWMTWSLEYHFLCFLIHNKEPFNLDIIEHTVNYYLKNHEVIQKIKGGFAEKYKSYAINYYKKYINQPIDDIIKELLNTSHTWDYYKIALHFIEIYLEIHMKLPEFLTILLLLIHPNPEFRPSTLDLRQINDTFINNYYIENDTVKINFSKSLSKKLKATILNKQKQA
jgi:hypothetical protein